MRVAEVMTTDVKTVSARTSAADAWDVMRRQGIHHLVVIDKSRVVGVLSVRDAGGRKGRKLRAESTVGDLMTHSVVTIDAKTTLRRAASLMRGRTIGCVPVFAGGRLKGILTSTDLLDVLGGPTEREARRRRADLHFRSPHRKLHRAYGAW